MAEVWCWLLLTSVLTEIITCQPARQPHDTKKIGKTLMDAKLNQEHSTWTRAYQAVRANRASFDGSEEGVGRLHSGKHLDVFNDGTESVHVPRYSAQQRSASTKRRARSQALRRNKLNSQSLRSHQIHTRRSADRHQEWIVI